MSDTQPPFYSYLIHVRWGDLDAYGHVNNTLYFRYFEETRFQLMLAKGIALKDDTHPVVVNIGCTFLRPVFYPDTLRIDVFLAEPGRSSFLVNYRLYTSADNQHPAAEGHSKIVWVDASSGKSVALPMHVRRWFENQ